MNLSLSSSALLVLALGGGVMGCSPYPSYVFPSTDAAPAEAQTAGGEDASQPVEAAPEETSTTAVLADVSLDLAIDSTTDAPGEAGPVCLSAPPHAAGLDCRCADGTVEQDFTQPRTAMTMVGCADVKANADAGVTGTSWENRASLCGYSCHVCSVAEWLGNHPSGTITPPTYNYWTNDNLQLSLSGNTGNSGDCAVSLSDAGVNTGACPGRPMHVCAHADASGATAPPVVDAVGTTCDIHDCGYNMSSTPGYFGGCAGNRTAGALCCCP